MEIINFNTQEVEDMEEETKTKVDYTEKYRKYRKNNPEIIKKINKRYYDKHRDKIIKNLCKKVKCEACNITLMISNKSKHNKTMKHKKNLIKLEKSE